MIITIIVVIIGLRTNGFGPDSLRNNNNNYNDDDNNIFDNQ